MGIIKTKIIKGDICFAVEQAVVVPCSSRGGFIGRGVDKAICSCYPEVYEQWCKVDGTLDFGDAVPFVSNDKVFIFVVIPPIQDNKSISSSYPVVDCTLEKCYANALKLADEKDCVSVAFPLLGSGALHWPMEDSFLALYTVCKNQGLYNFNVRNVVLYIYGKDTRALHYVNEAGWDVCEGENRKSAKESIVCEELNPYLLYESNALYAWNYEKKKEMQSFVRELSARYDSDYISDAAYLRNFVNGKIAEYEKKNSTTVKNIEIMKKCGWTNKNDISYIRNGNITFTPTKDKLIALSLVLKLEKSETLHLLAYFSFGFNTKYNLRDKIILKVIEEGNVSDVNTLNDILRRKKQNILGEKKTDDERKVFSELLENKICGVSITRGKKVDTKELSLKSGMRINEIYDIRNASKNFSPTKDKVVGLAIALRCNTEELEKWLAVFDFTLSDNKRDNIIRGVFQSRNIFDWTQLDRMMKSSNVDEMYSTKAQHKEREKDKEKIRKSHSIAEHQYKEYEK